MRTAPAQPIPVAVVYAPEDLQHLQTLEKQLSNLKRQGWIRLWTDQCTPLGTQPEPALREQLAEARIVLLLISPDFMASDFIHDVALRLLLERHGRNQVRLVPVFVRPTELKGHELGELQGIPRTRMPITEHSSSDRAWLEVASGLRDLLERLEPLRERPSPSRALEPERMPIRMTGDDETSSTPGRSLTLLHLSDLHFGQDRGEATARFDQTLVTQALLKDVQARVKEGLQPDAVLITGDIAFSGRPEQYAHAEGWLDALCSAVGLKPAQMLMVPGNHDVDRKRVLEKKTALHTHQQLRQKPLELNYYLREVEELQLTLWPKLAAFAAFASKLGGPTMTPAVPFWRHTLATRFGKPVVVVGLNSCLLSFDGDDAPTNLALGLGQLQPAFQGLPANALVLVLAHHPPEWLVDGVPGGACRPEHALSTFLQGHPHVLFVGHVHQQGGQVAHPLHSGGLLRFVAGAGHEAAHEGGRHAYAWVRIHADGIDFYPRQWNPERQRFQAEANRFELVKGTEYARIKRAKLTEALESWLEDLR